MSTPVSPSQATPDTPSAATLLKASVAAIVLAAVVLVTVVLPAEYDVDPTGIGGALGLTVFSAPADPAAPTGSTTTGDAGTRQTIEVAVPAGDGVEYKFAMSSGDKMTYEWLTDGAPLYLDLHGEPEGDTTDYFESYVEATANEMKGSFTAPFDGSHGWYWRNDTDDTVAVLLQVQGQFEVIGLK